MRIIPTVAIAVFLCQAALAQKFVTITDEQSASVPMPTGIYAPPPDLKDMKFKHGVSGQFEVMALDDATGLQIERNIEKIKKTLLTRWGLPDVAITAPVRMAVVRDKDIFKKLFRIDETRAEAFRSHNGQIIHVIYLLMDDDPIDAIAPPVTEILLAEFAKKYKSNVGWWAKKGMSRLNATPDDIRENISKLNNPVDGNKVFGSESLFTLTLDQWYKLNNEQRELYDNQCLALCLMLRKEFGQKNLHKFLQTSPQDGMKSVYRFYGFDEFDRSYKRYLQDIVREVGKNKTPTHYLTIKSAR